MRKVIVLGLDGLEPRIAEPMLEAGELPSLARLRAQGGYSRVRTTYPAQTPVAWSTFATGTNPGGHGIFDFVARDPKTYFPVPALTRYEQTSVFLPPRAVNLRRGTPVWELLSKAGIPSVVIRCPCTYPPENIQGRILAGIGVPDLRGGLGTCTFYSSDQSVEAGESENVVHLRVDETGRIATHLIGPRNPKTRSDFQFPITVAIDPSSNKAILHSEGQPRELEIREGEWSDWLRVRFKTGLLQSVRGMVQFHLTQLEPTFELYASPINFDPDAPLFPISAPPEYAGELARRLGMFCTAGMAEAHDGLNNERFDEVAYLEQCGALLDEREKMMQHELERLEEGLLFCLFDTSDRIQHMFWRFREKMHPANRGDMAPEMARVIEEHYRYCDAIVGRALQYANDQTLFIVISDHGMHSFQRGLHLNTWLYENGFLSLKNGIKPGDEAGDFLRSVEWDRTQAYTLGLGGIYLNLKGREANGVVDPEEAHSVQTAIARRLTGLRDPSRGEVAVRSVVAREQVYAGPYADESPDLLVNFSEGYRVSWGTPLGGVPEGLFEDNVKKWSGDHMIDPDLCPGVLFINRLFGGREVGLVDLAPTILAALGVPKGAAMEGASLLK